MMTSLVTAMAMSMAAPSAQQAEQCAGHYAFMSMMIVLGTPENASQADKDAAINKGLPWFSRADEVLVTSGVKKSGDDLPAGVTKIVDALFSDVAANKPNMAENVVKQIGDCDAAYGLAPLTI